jgi:DNA-directed RNA polymerase specialized sigma24 family protein
VQLTDEVLRAAAQGAKSVTFYGWEQEECVSAALESLVRKPTEVPGQAYVQGRHAAIEELRRLTGFRRVSKVKLVPYNEETPEHPVEELGYMDALDRFECEITLRKFSPRVRKVLELMMGGLSQRDAGAKLGISESRTSQLVARDCRRLGFR